MCHLIGLINQISLSLFLMHARTKLAGFFISVCAPEGDIVIYIKDRHMKKCFSLIPLSKINGETQNGSF